MGVKILTEDGALLHEFRDGLGVPLLARLIAAAKFRDDPDWDLVLNEHVAQLGIALRGATPQPAISPKGWDEDDALRQVQLRLTEALRHHVFTRAIPWTRWTSEQKRNFLRDVMFAPWSPSAQFVDDYIEDRDSEFARWQAALDTSG